jgi:hypothetical protein
VCDLLFCSTTPPDLFTFLENASHPRFAQDKALTGARKRVLQVVTRYIRLAGAQAVTRAHGERVVAVCFKVVRRDKSNTVKAELFRPMALLIDHGVLGNAAFDFQGNTHHDWLLQAYNESKVTQSVKGEILRLLGKLVEKFPLEMMDKVTNLLDMACYAVKKETSHHKPQLQVGRTETRERERKGGG